MLCTASDGRIDGGDHGLFFRDTRVLSRHDLTIGGRPPELVTAAKPESDRWLGVLRVPLPGGSAEGPQLPQDALEIVVSRSVGPGLVQAISVTNHSAVPCRTTLRLDLDADFADLAELHGERRQQGAVTREIDATRLRLHYQVAAADRHDERGIAVTAVDASSPPSVDESAISFAIDLQPRATWRATLRFAVLDGGTWGERSSVPFDRRARQRDAWRARRPALECAGMLRVPFERAADDLFDLRNWELEEEFDGGADGRRWILNAGVPMFTGLFGRDVITSGWQSALLGPRALLGALDAVAATLAEADDPWRDAEPGKLIHEQRFGPLAALGMTPRDAYYGSQTTPAMFVLALSELWHWTGDDDLLRRHVAVARKAVDWMQGDGDVDRDGFLEYRRRSPEGLRNQGWKDSDEAIRHADGSIAEGPVATVEEQAFAVIAFERLAEVLVALGHEAEADDHLRRAAELRGRWDEAFWMPADGFYAMALDGRKAQVMSIGSNAGHALGTGTVPPARARAVADRLLEADLFSGWGVRTLSERHPSYNPFAYHLGSVWPVEQATFALGFKRYGLDEHLDRLAEAVFQAAFASPDARLPEALAGRARESVPTPVPYPDANVPQAWSASALVQLVQVMLGLYPFAPLHLLAVVRPRLPAWAPTLTLRRLRVGAGVVDLRFTRRPDGSAAWRVTRRRGPLVVVGAPPPDDPHPGSVLERLELAAFGRVPGRLARAARIAFGRT